MTDPTEIPPALTPDEWRRALNDLPIVDHADFPNLAENMVSWAVSEAQTITRGDARHALAALCLHGQTFGFTHADVRGLRMLAGAHPAFGGALDELAARIAALLPPMETP